MLIREKLTRSLGELTANFPEEIYSFRKADHLTKLMSVLLLDPGLGQASKIQLLAKLSETLSGTSFSDLDVFYGIPLSFPRLYEENYDYDPFTDPLTSDQWEEVHIADGKYRSRLKTFMLSLTKGPTVEGLSLAAESIVGVSCEVIESWRYLSIEDTASYPGRLNTSYREFLIVPNYNTYSGVIPPATKRVLLNVLSRIKPAETVCSVRERRAGPAPLDLVTLVGCKSNSEYFEMRRNILPTVADSRIPTTKYEFLRGQESAIEAPTVAYMSTSETVIDLTTSIVRQTYPNTLRRSQSQKTWTEWRQIERANSPDNYPNGIANDGVFSWSSQSEWESYWSRYVLSVGGEVDGRRFRLPHLSDTSEIVNEDPVILARLPGIAIKSSWLGSI